MIYSNCELPGHKTKQGKTPQQKRPKMEHWNLQVYKQCWGKCLELENQSLERSPGCCKSAVGNRWQLSWQLRGKHSPPLFHVSWEQQCREQAVMETRRHPVTSTKAPAWKPHWIPPQHLSRNKGNPVFSALILFFKLKNEICKHKFC